MPSANLIANTATTITTTKTIRTITQTPVPVLYQGVYEGVPPGEGYVF
jgi:hypothetical protein